MCLASNIASILRAVFHYSLPCGFYTQTSLELNIKKIIGYMQNIHVRFIFKNIYIQLYSVYSLPDPIVFTDCREAHNFDFLKFDKRVQIVRVINEYP